MIEIFKTNLTKKQDAGFLRKKLLKSMPGYFVNFDLDDCDRILRIESADEVDANAVIALLKENNFHCELLND